MSLLLAEDESEATLYDALSFIDSWNDNNCGGMLSKGGSSLVLIEDGHQPQQSDQQQKQLKRKKAAGYSRKCQRRKKEELITLREQAVVLEMQVARLKHFYSLGHSQKRLHRCEAAGTTTNGRDEAIEQLHALQEAVRTNRKLKEIARQQARLGRSVRQLMSARFTVLETLRKEVCPATIDRPLWQPAYSTAILGELKGIVGRMRTERMPLWQGDVTSISSHVLETQDSTHGTVIEITTTTPLGYSMDVASRWLWETLSEARPYRDKAYNFVRKNEAATVEKSYLLSLSSSKQAITVNGVQFLQKFDSKDQVDLVRSNLLLLPTEGLRFRNHCWTSVTPSSADSSIVRTRVRLYAERHDESSALPKDFDDAHKLVVHSLARLYLDHAQMMQNVLLEDNYTGSA